MQHQDNPLQKNGNNEMEFNQIDGFENFLNRRTGYGKAKRDK